MSRCVGRRAHRPVSANSSPWASTLALSAPITWRVGSTVLQLVGDPRAEHAGGRGCGSRYLTVQVRDVVTGHTRLCQLGWGEEAAPIRLGDVAAISFVRDPDGTLLEVSQRASLTGPLPDH